MDTASQPRSRNPHQTPVKRPNFAKLFLPQHSNALLYFGNKFFSRNTSSEVIWYKSGVPTYHHTKNKTRKNETFIWIRLVHTATHMLNYGCLLVTLCSNVLTGNACYHSVQNLSSSRLLPKNLKIKIYRTIILPVVLYGCKTWTLTLLEEGS